MNSREGKLAKNTIILSIGTFLPKMAATITLPILTGYLTKDEFGTYDLITVLVSLLLPAATLQIQTAAFRFLIDVRDDEREIKKIITNIVVFIVPTSMIALTVLYLILSGQDAAVRLGICTYFLADIAVNSARQVCRGLNDNINYSISALISAAGKVIFAIVFVQCLGQGLLGTVVSLTLASTFSLLYLVFKVRLYRYFDLACFDGEKLIEMLKYSWPMVPNSMSAWVIRVSDRFVVTFFMGPAANAVYSVANKIPSLLNLAQNTFTMAWQENASIVSKDEDAGEYYSSMFRTMFDLMAGFFGLLIASTPLLFTLLIRGDYSEAYDQMPILFVAMFFYSMSTFLGGIYVAYKSSRSVGVTTTVAAACNLIVDIALIGKIGMYAASISTLVSYLLLVIYHIIDVQKLVRIRYDLSHMTWVIAVMVFLAVLCHFQNYMFDLLCAGIGFAMFVGLNRPFIKVVASHLGRMLSRKRCPNQEGI